MTNDALHIYLRATIIDRYNFLQFWGVVDLGEINFSDFAIYLFKYQSMNLLLASTIFSEKRASH